MKSDDIETGNSGLRLQRISVLWVHRDPSSSALMESLHGARLAVPEVQTLAEFELRTAESADRARSVLEAQSSDLVLLDMDLVDTPSLELVVYVRRRHTGSLVVVVAPYSCLERAINATLQGAQGFLLRPFTPREFIQCIQKATRQLLIARHARALEEERRQMRYRLISVVSHELQAPLAAVEGYLRVLQDPVAALEPVTQGRAVLRSLERLAGMRKLIQDLLDLAHIESGQQSREMQPTDLVEVVRRALDTVAAALSERRITLILELPEQCIMSAVPHELEIIVNNLLSNAVKYNRESGEIGLTMQQDDDRVTLRVRDTGVGMLVEERERIFGEFVRLRNPEAQGVPGSGLGLALVKRLVSLYQGAIAVESAADVGSTFTVVLPLRQSLGSRDPVGMAASQTPIRGF